MFNTHPLAVLFLVACATLCACSPKPASETAPAPESAPADAQSATASVAEPAQSAAAETRKQPDPETMTPEERLEYFPGLSIVRPDPNFREILSPLVRDAKVNYSQFYEELVIRDFFQDEKDGVFLDVGCYHPIHISTTYYLEHHLGWHGYAIDAIAEHEEEWKQERPRSKFFSYAITDHDGDTITFYSHGGTSSVDKQASEVFGGESRPIEVPTITLTTLLDREGVKGIDFLSIDIEGSEPGAFKGFDIQRFKPRLVCVEQEVGKTPSEKNEFLIEYFKANGYERIDKYLAVDKLNWYFTPKSAL
jgi:FkbM family methyltransferase